jgi:hypothetical protein
MSPVVYLLRSPSQTISPSLYQSQSSALVISIEDTFPPGKVVKTTSECPLTEGEELSYQQLLAVLFGNKKIVTL